MKRILLMVLCMGFLVMSASACAVKANDGVSESGENAWSDENVDDNGWI